MRVGVIKFLAPRKNRSGVGSGRVQDAQAMPLNSTYTSHNIYDGLPTSGRWITKEHEVNGGIKSERWYANAIRFLSRRG